MPNPCPILAATGFRTFSATSSPVQKSGPAPQAAPGPDGGAAALERRGRRLRPSADDGGARSGRRRRTFDNCVASMWPDAARRNITQENFERFTAGLTPDLRIMDLMDSQPEFTKAIWDYLDILVNDNRLAKGREILAKYKPQFDAVEKAYGVDRYVDRVDLGHRDRTTRRRWATAAWCNPPRRWPASAAARPISRTSSSPRWKSSTAAICAPSRCAAPGPARSGRRSSCRPPSSATPSTPTATAAATSSTTPPT